uniref:ATP-dependent RNA helicase n=1 Tax=Panagrolaimus sp. JU765 TaxID=591449 RepID=A0AC34PYZ8_9BILA
MSRGRGLAYVSGSRPEGRPMPPMNNGFDDEFAEDSNMYTGRRPPAPMPVYGGPSSRPYNSNGQVYRDTVPPQNNFDEPPRPVPNMSRPSQGYSDGPGYGGRPVPNDMRQRMDNGRPPPPYEDRPYDQGPRGQPRSDVRDFGSSRGPPPSTTYRAENRYDLGRMNQNTAVMQNGVERSTRTGYPPQNDRQYQGSQPPYQVNQMRQEQQPQYNQMRQDRPSNDVRMNNGMNGGPYRPPQNNGRDFGGPTFGGAGYQDDRNGGRPNYQDDRSGGRQNYQSNGYSSRPPQDSYRQPQDNYINNGPSRDYGPRSGYPPQQNGYGRDVPMGRNPGQYSPTEMYEMNNRLANSVPPTRGGFGVAGRGGNTLRGSFTNGSATRGGAVSRAPEVSRFEQRYESQNVNKDEKKNRAPRNFKPEDRTVQDIVNYDREIAERDGNKIDEDADITVEGADVELVCQNWSDMELHPKLIENIEKSGYIRPRKVQQYTVPYVKDGYDCQVQCETGTGKTAAFLIPVIDMCAKLLEKGEKFSSCAPIALIISPTRELFIDMCAKLLEKGEKFSSCAPIALIISPTRELCNQLYDESKKFAEGTKVKVARCFGEYNVRDNIQQLRIGCHVLCACLGRLLQFVREQHVNLTEVKYLVIDEADRLIGDINNQEIIELLQTPDLNNKRQTMLFSATLDDPSVTVLVEEAFKLDKRVMIKANNKSNVRLNYEVHLLQDQNAKHQEIVKYIQQITKDGNCPKILIFVNKKVDTDTVAIRLTQQNLIATTIHGDRGQDLRQEAMGTFKNDLRQEAMGTFKNGKTPILVATDVAARGVDIKDLDYVINFDLPKEPATFVQRCGRTGRTHKGTAVSFFNPIEDALFKTHLAEIIVDAGQQCPDFLLDDYDFNRDYSEAVVLEEQDSNVVIEEPLQDNDSVQNDDENSEVNGNVNDHEAVVEHMEESVEMLSLANAAVTKGSTPQEVIHDANADEGWD